MNEFSTALAEILRVLLPLIFLTALLVWWPRVQHWSMVVLLAACIISAATCLTSTAIVYVPAFHVHDRALSVFQALSAAGLLAQVLFLIGGIGLILAARRSG